MRRKFLLLSGEMEGRLPVWRTSTSSPLSTKLAATKSHPRVPEPETANGCAAGSVLRKSFRSMERVSPKTFTNAAPTWLSLKTPSISEGIITHKTGRKPTWDAPSTTKRHHQTQLGPESTGYGGLLGRTFCMMTPQKKL